MSAHRGDDHRRGGLQPGYAAFDVEEFLRAEVGAEAGFGHDVVAELERGARRDGGIAAVGDVGERAAVHERRRSFERLHEIGFERVLEQRGHRSFAPDLGRRHRLLVAPVADDHPAEARLEIVEIGREAERRHGLGRDRDVEPVLARKAVAWAAETGDRHAQRAVVQVERPAPDDAALVDAEPIAPVNMVVDHRGQEIVGGCDGVEIAGEMKIDRVHWHDLGIAAAGGAALHAETRTEAWLPQTDGRFPATAVERIN